MLSHKEEVHIMINKAVAISLGVLVVAVLVILMIPTTRIPAGQVGGVLVEEDGQPYGARTVSLFLATVVDEARGQVELNTTWKSRLDESGSFSFEDVPSDRYCLAVFCHRRGALLGFVFDGGGLYTFSMPENAGVNLGSIDASNIGRLSG